MQSALTSVSARPNTELHTVSEWLDRCLLLTIRPSEAEPAAETVDLGLIHAACSGDENAFRQIVDCFQETIAAQMRRFSRDQNVVEDLVHDVFVEAFMSLGNFKSKSPFEHWLRKIAVRVGYRHWKSEAREMRRAEKLREATDASSLVTEAPQNALEAREQLHFMVSKLTPRDRLVLTLLYWDGHSVAEAAKLAGWTQSLVKVQAHRARKRLKKLLEQVQ